MEQRKPNLRIQTRLQKHGFTLHPVNQTIAILIDISKELIGFCLLRLGDAPDGQQR